MTYKFKIEILLANVPNKDNKEVYHKEYYYIGVSTNGKTLFTSETYKRNATLKKTINHLFNGVKIIDKSR